MVLSLAAWLVISSPSMSRAEWYAAGYGGISLAGSLSNVNMPRLGDSRAQAQYGSPPNTQLGEFLSNNFRSSDLFLKQSPMFGAKVGYFFNDFKLPWLGAEFEAFSTQPNIKTQSINTSLFINQCRIVPPAVSCIPSTSTTNQTESFGEARLRVNTFAANAVARYRSGRFQPYAGLGLGLFHFSASGSVNESALTAGLNAQAGMKWFLTESVAAFSEYKFNRATVNLNDPVYGLKGTYEITHLTFGIGYHFK